MSVCALPVTAAEHTVAPSGAEFVSIQDAVDWASSGDTIFVESGTYYETIILNKKIILRGIDRVAGSRSLMQARWATVWISGWTAAQWSTSSSRTGRSSPVSVLHPVIIPCGRTLSAVLARVSTCFPPSGVRLPAIISRKTAGQVSYSRHRITMILNTNTVTKNTIGITLDEYSLSNRIDRNNFQQQPERYLQERHVRVEFFRYLHVYLSRAEETEPDGQLLE